MILSTAEVAKKIGVNKATLERWLAGRKVRKPQALRIGRKVFRNWKEADVEDLRKYKQENYRKGRGRKPKPKR